MKKLNWPIFILFMKPNFGDNEQNCPLMSCMWYCNDSFLNLIQDKSKITCGTSVAFFVKNLAMSIQSDHWRHFKCRLKGKSGDACSLSITSKNWLSITDRLKVASESSEVATCC